MMKQHGATETDENFWRKLWRHANTDFSPWFIKTVEWVLIIASLILAVSAIFRNLYNPVFVYISVIIAALSLIIGLAEAPVFKKLPSYGTGMIVFIITLIIVTLQFFGVNK